MGAKLARGFTQATTAFTTVVDLTPEIVLDGDTTDLVFSLANTSANALTDLFLVAKAHKDDAEFVTILSGAEWGTLTAMLLAKGTTAGILNTLAGSAKARAHIRVGPWYSVKLRATAGAACTTTVNGRFR